MANRNPSPSSRFKSGAEWRGNAKGRPPGRSITAMLRDMLDQTTFDGKELPDGKTVASLVAEVIIRGALAGRFPFLKMLLDRTEGKVRDRVEEPAYQAPRIRILWEEDAVDTIYGRRDRSPG